MKHTGNNRRPARTVPGGPPAANQNERQES